MVEFSPNDPSSYSRPDLAAVTFISISLNVDFAAKTFKGHVDLTVKKLKSSINEIILDAKDLTIESIANTCNSCEKLEYSLGENQGEFGSSLTIKLPSKEIEPNTYKIRIDYETNPKASGLQWLEPEQTAGKKSPYVFSQFQAIHARTFLPCQDTPSIKCKYEATIGSPKNLTVVMSAIRGKDKEEGNTKYSYFKQDVPIQTYLIAIAIGALKSEKIGPRSNVWAEESIVKEAAYEFANTEKQLKVAEDICGPYVWGIYDLLVLPPSFPFGGMENPCLTFVTPTLLAGDRSLANVVAHEIAHSWTGNLVTNANFEHFWLNEGFTVFIERKILGRLEGQAVQDFQAYGGFCELAETIKDLGATNPLTNLVVNLTGVHPDDSFSRVPYEKGYIFLRYLEQLVGGPDAFEPFLRKYFSTYKYKSLTTTEFREFFETEFANITQIKSVDWDSWLNKPGMPPTIPEYDKTLRNTVDKLMQKWSAWTESQEVPFSEDELTSLLKIQLLQEILNERAQPTWKLEQTEEKFKFLNCRNSEIKYRWLRIGLNSKWENALEPTLAWINEVGRMKFIRPIYRDLYNWEGARAKAIANFEANRKYMMHVCAYTVAQDLRL